MDNRSIRNGGHGNEGEWLRVQYGMAHHDIWWVKSQQMKVGNWTLLLLGALVAVSKLMHDARPSATILACLLKFLSIGVTVLGVIYVWDLYCTLVRSRNRAAKIVDPLEHVVFEDVKRPGERHLVFPIAITVLLVIAMSIVLWLITAVWTLANLPVQGI